MVIFLLQTSQELTCFFVKQNKKGTFILQKPYNTDMKEDMSKP